MIKNYILIIFFLSNISSYSQNMPFSYINTTSDNLLIYLSNNSNYWKGKTRSPYFQSKNGGTYIKFYDSYSTIVTIDFKKQTDFYETISEIKNKAIFNFKYCSNYRLPVVYNYQTNFNKIRFNLTEMQISIEYNSDMSEFIQNNENLLSVFICSTNDSYAYHTNVRCFGLSNCSTNIQQTDMQTIKKTKYRICKLCTDDSQ